MSLIDGKILKYLQDKGDRSHSMFFSLIIFRLILFHRVHKLTRLQKGIVYGGEPLQVYFKRACVKAYLSLTGHL